MTKVYEFPKGKALFVHKIKTYSREALRPGWMSAADGPIWESNAEMAQGMLDLGVGEIWVKISDGKWKYNVNPTRGDVILGPWIQALRDVGIRVWGWSYFYGTYPEQSADLAADQVIRFGLDGFIANAEGYLKHRPEVARVIAQRLNERLPVGMKWGLSSYKWPSYHPEFPWRQFLDRCDFNVPQVYWIGAHNPTEQLARTISESNKIAPQLPVYVTGSAFKHRISGWQASAAEVDEFDQVVKDLKLKSISWWEGWHAWRLGLLDVIGAHDWSDGDPDPPELTIEERVTRLEEEAIEHGWEL